MYNIPDDPIIRCMERTGMPPWLQEPESQYVCPVCGEECETIYTDKHSNEVVGCDNCIRALDVWQIEN